MNNKKILLSLFLVLLVAISVSSVSADDSTDIISTDDAEDVIAIDDASESLSADPITPANDSVAAVQTAVDSVVDGSVVDLSGYAEYDFGDSNVTITKGNFILQGNGSTIIKGYGNGNGLIDVKSSNVTIQGIKFIDTNPENNFTYGGSVNGWGVYFGGVSSGLISDCSFKDFKAAIAVRSSTGVVIENNYFEGGYSTLIANDPTVSKKVLKH